MNQPFDPSAVVVLLLFILRLGVPLALSLLLAWGLHRLDATWQAQSRCPHPASTANAPLAVQEPGAGSPARGLVDRPCWEYRACPEAKRQACPAGCGTDMLCWMARLRHDGRLPSGCRTCPIFTTTSPLAASLGGAD